MTQVSREWATPLTIGAFLLMSATGLLMFFHADTELQKTLHEWLGWGLVAAVVAHVLANGRSFMRYLQPSVSRRAPVLIGLCALLLMVTFFVRPPEGEEGGSPPALALHAITAAPLKTVAPLFGHDAASARRALADAGINMTNEDQSLDAATAGDREQLGHALRALARAPGS